MTNDKFHFNNLFKVVAEILRRQEAGRSETSEQRTQLGGILLEIASKLALFQQLLALVTTLDRDYSHFDINHVECDDEYRAAKDQVRALVAKTDLEPLKTYVLMADLEGGPTSRVFLSLTGAESALVQAALEYQRDGRGTHTPETLRAELDTMRAARSRNEHHVVEFGNLGVLWIEERELEV